MSLSKKDLIIFFLISLLFYFHFKKKENFSDLGLIKLPDGSIGIKKNLYVDGNISIEKNLNVVGGNISIANNLNVGGNIKTERPCIQTQYGKLCLWNTGYEFYHNGYKGGNKPKFQKW